MPGKPGNPNWVKGVSGSPDKVFKPGQVVPGSGRPRTRHLKPIILWYLSKTPQDLAKLLGDADPKKRLDSAHAICARLILTAQGFAEKDASKPSINERLQAFREIIKFTDPSLGPDTEINVQIEEHVGKGDLLAALETIYGVKIIDSRAGNPTERVQALSLPESVGGGHEPSQNSG